MREGYTQFTCNNCRAQLLLPEGAQVPFEEGWFHINGLSIYLPTGEAIIQTEDFCCINCMHQRIDKVITEMINRVNEGEQAKQLPEGTQEAIHETIKKTEEHDKVEQPKQEKLSTTTTNKTVEEPKETKQPEQKKGFFDKLRRR